ncbi:MAG: type II/IV secretion system protein [Myxococcales bacterium]|nr:MAG: type II/IV secretion system protein [Myxococcales bacterium]
MSNPSRGGQQLSSTEPYSDGDAVTVLDELLRRAMAAAASDIHLEPKREYVQVRFRIDGTMVEQRSIDYAQAVQVVQRIKVLSRMDIAERRVPQDGQFSLQTQGQTMHLRASTFPSSQGEKVVMRLLRGHNLMAYSKLGLDPDDMRKVRDVVLRPQGFVITCGPTGSGKTSTLYALLQLIDTARVNVVTLEDPIEVELMSITQGQTHARSGFTFAAGLRAILRQDPDVILVGEMRDAETSAIALQAALTGHLVLSTLHTSDTVETVVRLVDLGVEPWIIANALSAVIAQRLVRVVCPSCKAPAKLKEDLWDGDEVLLPAGSDIVRPTGCDACHRTGYKGRTGIFEVLELDDDLRELVKAKATAQAYRAVLRQRRIKTLRRSGFSRVMAGITTVDEVLRVTT